MTKCKHWHAAYCLRNCVLRRFGGKGGWDACNREVVNMYVWPFYLNERKKELPLAEIPDKPDRSKKKAIFDSFPASFLILLRPLESNPTNGIEM